jgi:hypothetical protein
VTTPSKSVNRLSDDEVGRLSQLLGRKVFTMFTPTVEAHEDRVSAPFFSVSAVDLDTYVVIESDWADTEVEAIDFHVMRVVEASWPRGVPKVADPSGNGREILGPPVSTVHVDMGATPIVHIAVLKHVESGLEEAVEYDSGCVFTFANGRYFALMTSRSIAGGIEFLRDEAAIRKRTVTDYLRIEVGNDLPVNPAAAQPGLAVGPGPRWRSEPGR